MKENETIFANVGSTIARLHRGPERSGYEYYLTLVEPSLTDEQVHTPAQDIAIYGLKSLRALRDLLDKAIKDESIPGSEGEK